MEGAKAVRVDESLHVEAFGAVLELGHDVAGSGGDVLEVHCIGDELAESVLEAEVTLGQKAGVVT